MISCGAVGKAFGCQWDNCCILFEAVPRICFKAICIFFIEVIDRQLATAAKPTADMSGFTSEPGGGGRRCKCCEKNNRAEPEIYTVAFGLQ